MDSVKGLEAYIKAYAVIAKGTGVIDDRLWVEVERRERAVQAAGNMTTKATELFNKAQQIGTGFRSEENVMTEARELFPRL